MSYSNQGLVEALLGRDLTDPEILMLSFVLGAVDAYIDSETGTPFSSGASTTRYYDAGRWDDLQTVISIDQWSDITAIECLDIDGTTVLDTYVEHENYELGPRNATIKTYIERQYYPFWPGNSTLAVTGTYGSGSVPNDIVYLATYLACKYISSGGFLDSGTTGPIKKESIEGYSREYSDTGASMTMGSLADEIVENILDRYRANEVLL